MEITKKLSFVLLAMICCLIVILLHSQTSLALGEFVDSGIPFLGLDYSAADLDLLLAGRISADYGTNVTYIYRNDGNNIFTKMPNSLKGISWGVAAWIDYDNDGHIDIFLTGCPDGQTCSYAVTKLYHNNNDGTWSEVGTPFIQVGRSGADWGDYDQDGYLDLFIVGSHLPGRLYQNMGDGTFQDTGLSFPALHEATASWGDYDNDNFLDIAIAGIDKQVRMHTYIYHNNGNGSFTDISAGMQGVCSGALAWGDFDNNGRLDLLVSGCDKVYCEGFTRLYQNTLDPILPEFHVYIPTFFIPEVSFPLVINTEPIPSQPVIQRGEVFYTRTLTIPPMLPEGGNFYLSASGNYSACHCESRLLR